jgi:hypothetical protein
MISPIGQQGKPLRIGLHPRAEHKFTRVTRLSGHFLLFHPIEGVNDLVRVEHGQQILYGLRCVSRPRLDVLPQDTPRILDGAQKSVLVGGTHEGQLQHSERSSRCF